MAKGRGSANSAAALVGVLMLCLLINGQIVESAIYTVGGGGGWTFNTVGWPNGKSFRAGDVLVFKYSPGAHDVVPVNAAGYKSCKVPRGSKKLTSGNDRIRLRRGTNYFVCSFAGHCQAGMKMAVRAA